MNGYSRYSEVLKRNICCVVEEGRLTELRIRNANLITIPDDLKMCTKLGYLDLSGNNLETLPDIFDYFLDLGGLELSNNRLKTLPDSIGNLRELIDISLTSNRIERLPRIILLWTKLDILLECHCPTPLTREG